MKTTTAKSNPPITGPGMLERESKGTLRCRKDPTKRTSAASARVGTRSNVTAGTPSRTVSCTVDSAVRGRFEIRRGADCGQHRASLSFSDAHRKRRVTFRRAGGDSPAWPKLAGGLEQHSSG